VLSLDSAGKDSGKLDSLYVSIVIMCIIANAIAIHYSPPGSAIRFLRLHMRVPLSSPRFLCITHSARDAQ
jgi:hypothetical protein